MLAVCKAAAAARHRRRRGRRRRIEGRQPVADAFTVALEKNTKHTLTKRRTISGSERMKAGPGFDGTIARWYPGRRGIILLIVPRALSPSAVVIPGVLLVLPGCTLTFVLTAEKNVYKLDAYLPPPTQPCRISFFCGSTASRCKLCNQVYHRAPLHLRISISCSAAPSRPNFAPCFYLCERVCERNEYRNAENASFFVFMFNPYISGR